MILPDLDSLRCVLAAAESPSFRAAAARVALSPAAFSERIKRLEEQLETPLFVRRPRRIELTAAGRRFIGPAREAVEAAGRCVTRARGEGRLPPFRLRLGTRFELGLSWLVPALDDLRAARPERTIDLYFGESDALLERLAAGRLDGVVSSVRIDRAGLAYVPLHEEDYVFCAAPALLARRPLDGPAQAGGHRLIDTQPDLPLFRYLRDARSADEVWAFADVEHMGTIAAVRARVRAEAGVAVLPRYFVADDLASGRLVPLFADVALPTDRFRLLWTDGVPLADELRALGEALQGRPLT